MKRVSSYEELTVPVKLVCYPDERSAALGDVCIRDLTLPCVLRSIILLHVEHGELYVAMSVLPLWAELLDYLLSCWILLRHSCFVECSRIKKTLSEMLQRFD